jgi:hypothetical protein
MRAYGSPEIGSGDADDEGGGGGEPEGEIHEPRLRRTPVFDNRA